jgi:hypothetical protein
MAAGALLLLALLFDRRAALAQSCAGKAAGDVCRPAAGSCDIAESCVATGGSAGAPMFQPADGALATDVPWTYTMGYAFTPNKTVVVTSLGGFFNGTKTVYLYSRTTGAVLASATVTAANGWAYATIPPLTLDKDLPYSIAVDLGGAGGAYRYSMAAMPRYLADATIEGSCYRYGSAAEPCASSGLFSGTNYGMADFKYLTTAGLYQPTDGTLYTDMAGDYLAGYAFTPNKSMTLTHLGGLFNGTRNVYLYNRATGALLASASVPSANAWIYTRITPITLTAGTPFTVAVYLPGTGGAYRAGVAMPTTRADASIDGTCYRPASIAGQNPAAEPCAYSGLITGNDYGIADIKYAPTGGGLTCPADTLVAAGTVCRAATGACDVAETCTGTSGACPANAFVPAGVVCNDNQLCTFNDVCNGAGSCGGTSVTCGGGNACSTTVCNGTSTCEAAQVFCNNPPGDCYNTLGTCNTGNGTCSYTVRVGAPCGTRGTCQSSGECSTSPLPVATSTPSDCDSQTIPFPTPLGCDSCDPNHPCVVDSTITVPVEFQTCSGYTPRKGDIVLHDALGLTHVLISSFGSSWTHIGVFQDPQPANADPTTRAKQLVTHQAINLDGLAQSVLRPDWLQSFLIGLSLNKNSAYCKSAKIDPATLLDQGYFLPGVLNTHTADITTESNGSGGQFWGDGILDRMVVIAANRASGEAVANGMALRNDYYSLNSLVDDVKGMGRQVNGRPGTNCASAIMSCITPQPPRTLLQTSGMRSAAMTAYELIRKQVRHMPQTESAVTLCKVVYACIPGLPCPVDCDGLAWETANGIADQVIACILFGPTPGGGCECTRDNRKWHFAQWASAAPAAPTQDDLDWVNHRLTDVEFFQDPWTGSAASGQPTITINPSSTFLPRDVMGSANYPASNGYYLKRRVNATRKYGHCWIPPALIVTPSPPAAYYGWPITWTATASGGDTASLRYAFFRRRAGDSSWVPDVSSPNWQTSNVYTWTPGAADVGTWDTYVWVKDAYTSAGMNTYGYAAGYNTGGVQIVAPPTLSVTPSPASATCGTAITWTATASNGVPSTRQYALFRRRSGTSSWTPDVGFPGWQNNNVLTWTPSSSDAGTWEIYVWLRDSATPASMNSYGYAAGVNPGPVNVTCGPSQLYPAKGWVDGYNTQHIWGWACDPDYPTQSNRVDFYTTSGQSLGSTGAFLSSSAAIANACLGGYAHYFDFYPSGGIPSGTHFNAWSIDLPYATPGNDNRKCGGSGSIGDGTEFVIP